jgi:hypothetical protein
VVLPGSGTLLTHPLVVLTAVAPETAGVTARLAVAASATAASATMGVRGRMFAPDPEPEGRLLKAQRRSGPEVPRGVGGTTYVVVPFLSLG